MKEAAPRSQAEPNPKLIGEPSPRKRQPAPAAEAPLTDAERRSQESFDVGVWAALDLCRQRLTANRKYNPFQAFEERIILLALRETRGNQYRAAKLLGISRSTLRKRMKKHAINIGVRLIEDESKKKG